MSKIVIVVCALTFSRSYAQKNWKELEFVTPDNKKNQVMTLLPAKRYTVIDIWGLWCRPCLEQHTMTQRMAEQYEAHIQIMALNYKDDRKKWLGYVKQNQHRWIHGQVTQKTVVKFQVFKFPFNVLLDQNGVTLCEDCSIEEIEDMIKSGIADDK